MHVDDRSAIHKFGHRWVPMLNFSPVNLIDDSIERVTQYMVAAVTFVSNHVTTETTNGLSMCPFQFDVCVASGEPTTRQYLGDFADDDDDDADHDSDYNSDALFFDTFGDIQAKLEHNKLRYVQRSKMSMRGHHVFDDLYKCFVAEHQVKETFLHRRRMVALVDRRGPAKGRYQEYDAWLFEPPADCAEIPDHAVPEWFLNASKTTLLPHIGYRAHEMNRPDWELLHSGDAVLQEQARAMQQNVSSSFHGDG